MILIMLAVMFFICLVFYKPGFKFFLLWLALCAAFGYFFNASGCSGALYCGFWGAVIYVFIWSNDGPTEEKSSTNSSSGNGSRSKGSYLYDKVYEDGSHRIENLSQTGYYYSDGKESWVGMLGEEHRSNGEVVRKNAYIPGRRDIYNSAGEYIGYEYEDSCEITHRVVK